MNLYFLIVRNCIKLFLLYFAFLTSCVSEPLSNETLENEQLQYHNGKTHKELKIWMDDFKATHRISINSIQELKTRATLTLSFTDAKKVGLLDHLWLQKVIMELKSLKKIPKAKNQIYEPRMVISINSSGHKYTDLLITSNQYIVIRNDIYDRNPRLMELLLEAIPPSYHPSEIFESNKIK